MSKYKILDLFCGAGGCSMGYKLAGLEPSGVDINEQTQYPFHFVRGNALELVCEMSSRFDAIHASPPCQCFTKYRNCRKDISSRYEDLITATRECLVASGKPWIMENVVGSPLLAPVTLCGSMFGLDVRRHRLFESSFPIRAKKCDHSVWQPNRFPGGRSRERGHARVLCRGTIEVGRWNIPLSIQQAGMGINWITDLRMLSEAIPPAFTKYIGEELIAFLNMEAEPTSHNSRVTQGAKAHIAEAATS